MSPPVALVLVFSSTVFATEMLPTSQPARVYDTHGAGVVFGVPLSPFTMFGVVSAGAATGSVQYLNDDENVGVTATVAIAAAMAAAMTIRLALTDSLPFVDCSPVVPQESLVGHRSQMGGEVVKRWCRPCYKPRGRAAPKYLPASGLTKPIRSY